MREPVVVLVAGHLLLVAAVRFHSPDLHSAGASRTEIDVLSIRCIFRSIVESLFGRQLELLPASGSNLIDIELTVSSAGKDQELAVRGPAMHVRRALRGDPEWLAAANRNSIDNRPVSVFSWLVADAEHLAIK